MTNKLPNFASPHCHIQSFDSASTPEEFAKRELEIGSEYLTITDHGTLEADRRVYDLCAKGGKYHGKLTPILGMEGYFRDDNCPILRDSGVEQSLRYRNQLTGKVVTEEAFKKLPPEDQQLCLPEKGYWGHNKYYHITMHFLDQDSFETAARLLSKADLRAEQHGSERKPLFDWADLEELGAHNTVFCSSCLIGMVSRHLLAHDDWRTAQKYYEKVRSIAKPNNFYVEMFPHTCDKNWDEGVFIRFADSETPERFPVWKTVKTALGNIKVQDLAHEFHKHPETTLSKHKYVDGVMQSRKMVEHPARVLVSVEHREGWLYNECRPWAPDKDLQLGVNRFMMEMATLYGDKILISDDSHFARPEERVAQDVRLGQNGSWRFANSHHRLTNDEAFGWFRSRMGISDKQLEEWVDNSHEWGSRFKDFQFKSRKSLPVSFYPEDTLAHIWKLIDKHGRMNWGSQPHLDRLAAEIRLLHDNGTIDLLPYFMIDEEVCSLYTSNGELTGPGRGSAAGLLLTYLLGITHVDPLRYGLSMDRFMTKIRIQSGKLPDIDQDLSSRDLLVGIDVPGFDVLMEDGSLLRVEGQARVKTANGEMLVEEAFKRGLDIEEWL